MCRYTYRPASISIRLPQDPATSATLYPPRTPRRSTIPATLVNLVKLLLEIAHCNSIQSLFNTFIQIPRWLLTFCCNLPTTPVYGVIGLVMTGLTVAVGMWRLGCGCAAAVSICRLRTSAGQCINQGLQLWGKRFHRWRREQDSSLHMQDFGFWVRHVPFVKCVLILTVSAAVGCGGCDFNFSTAESRVLVAGFALSARLLVLQCPVNASSVFVPCVQEVEWEERG